MGHSTHSINVPNCVLEDLRPMLHWGTVFRAPVLGESFFQFDGVYRPIHTL